MRCAGLDRLCLLPEDYSASVVFVRGLDDEVEKVLYDRDTVLARVELHVAIIRMHSRNTACCKGGMISEGCLESEALGLHILPMIVKKIAGWR